MTRLRIFLLDDHALFLKGLALLLSTQAKTAVEVVGLSTRADEAVPLITAIKPDIAMVDLSMPRLTGVDVIRALKKRSPTTKTIALSGTDDLDLAERALRAGACAYLTKSADPDELLNPLLTAAQGLCVLAPDMLDRLLAVSRKPPESLLDTLEPQDLRLWELVARGLETSDIAQRLRVSERTTKRLVAALLHKVGAANRTEAAGLAGRYGLLDSASDIETAPATSR